MHGNLTEAFARNINRATLKESDVSFSEHVDEIISKIDGVSYEDGKIYPDYLLDKHINYIKDVYGVYDDVHNSIKWYTSLRGNICDKFANETRFDNLYELIYTVNEVMVSVEEELDEIGMQISHAIMEIEDNLDGI